MTLPVRAPDLPGMRILLVNVPHPSIGSRIPDDHLPPLGLLSIGGPLIDDGHEVRLLDADLEAGRRTTYSAEAIAAEAAAWRPDAVLFGHSGSTSAHPVVAEISRAVRRLLPRATIVYGGVFPTYHWREILEREPQIDVIVRGEGEETCVALLRALQDGGDLRADPGTGPAHGGDAAGAGDRGPRPLSRRLGAHRSPALQLLGRDAGRRRAVLARLSAPLQLLRPARVLDEVAPPRPGEVRRGARAAASGARGGADQLRGREPDRRPPGLEALPGGADRGERAAHARRLDARGRHRPRRGPAAALPQGGLGPLPAGHGEHRRGHPEADPQGRLDDEGPRGHPAAAGATASSRWRPGSRGSRRTTTATSGAGCDSCSPTIRTRSRRSTSRRTAGRPTSDWPPAGA